VRRVAAENRPVAELTQSFGRHDRFSKALPASATVVEELSGARRIAVPETTGGAYW
jgi:hypothetical protein